MLNTRLNTRAITLPAPAKLNLFLRITGRRPSGYHELQTLFQFIDLVDEVHLQSTDDGVVRRAAPIEGVPVGDDLCVRAARALKDATGSSQGCALWVDKHIPMGGGLGGGSSDAATVLVGLNQLWECGLSREALCEIGLTLGADVPVFIHGQATWAEGVGEQFTPVAVEEAQYLLALPAEHVATASIFSAQDLTRDCQPLTIGGFPSAGGFINARELMRAGNVCEPVVRRLHPEVGTCLDWLSELGVARMTGTGAACFALLDEDSAHASADATGRWKTLRVCGMNTSPLLSVLKGM
jgi:4-diphosphocytidyl-2-C-methyl-D-erythritol kinase